MQRNEYEKNICISQNSRKITNKLFSSAAHSSSSTDAVEFINLFRIAYVSAARLYVCVSDDCVLVLPFPAALLVRSCLSLSGGASLALLLFVAMQQNIFSCLFPHLRLFASFGVCLCVSVFVLFNGRAHCCCLH